MNGRDKADKQKDSSARLGFEAKLRVPYALRLPALSIGRISSYDQEGDPITRRLAIMNLAPCGSEADFVGCMIALPGQFFYSTQIPACLWFTVNNKAADAKRGFRDRRKQTIFIDARKFGTLIDRVPFIFSNN